MATLVIKGGDGGCGFRKQLCLPVKGENMVALTFVGNVSNGDGGANKRFERQGDYFNRLFEININLKILIQSY